MSNNRGTDHSKKGEEIINDLISGVKRNTGEEAQIIPDLKFGNAFAANTGSLALGAGTLLNPKPAKSKKKPLLERTFNQNVGSRRGFNNGKGAGRSFGKGNGEGRGPGARIGKVAGSKEK